MTASGGVALSLILDGTTDHGLRLRTAATRIVHVKDPQLCLRHDPFGYDLIAPDVLGGNAAEENGRTSYDTVVR